MKKYYFTCVCLSIFSSVFSQTRQFVERNHSIDPFVTYIRSTVPSEREYDSQNIVDELDSDKFNFRYSTVEDFYQAGFNYSYTLKDNLYLLSGLALANQTFSTYDIENKKIQNTKYQRYLLEIPLGLRWVYTKSWCKSFLQGEYITQYNLNPARAKQNSAMIANSKFFRTIKVSVGAEFNLTEKFCYFAQLSSFTQLIPNRNTYALGLGISIGSRIYL